MCVYKPFNWFESLVDVKKKVNEDFFLFMIAYPEATYPDKWIRYNHEK